MELYEKNGNILYILQVLKQYSDENHKLTIADIQKKVQDKFNIYIDGRTIRRNINLLKYKEELNYDISTREENKQGYYIDKDPDTDFEAGEIRAIIDTFNYSSYIVPSVAKNIIKKCKKLQNEYENKKLKDYKIYSKDLKTSNMEVVKNIEDITEGIYNKKKIVFDYWKYDFSQKFSNKIEGKIVSKPKVSPYALVYDNQQFYMIAIKDGEDNFFRYRLDRIKNIKVTDENIQKKEEKEIKEFADKSLYQFGGIPEEIEAIIEKNLLNGVIDDFGLDVNVEEIDDKYFKLNITSDLVGFKMWAMRNIDKVTIVKPESLKKEMQDIIWLAGERYGK